MLIPVCAVLLIASFPTVQCAPNTITRSLDFSEVCSKVAEYQKVDYCWNFNDTCSRIFLRKEICRKVEMECGSGVEKCVLHNCREYTGKVRQLPPSQIGIATGGEYTDHTEINERHARRVVNGTSFCGRFEFLCERSFEQLERVYAPTSICRTAGKMCEPDINDEQKGKGNCKFVRCTKEEQNEENHPVIPFDSLTIRTTPIEETDIDETKYAVEFALWIGENKNYCDAFREGCRECLEHDNYESERKYKIKEVVCIPQRTGGPALSACILTEVHNS